MRKQQSSPPEDLHSALVLAASLLVKLYPFRVIEVSLSWNLAYGVMRAMSGCSDKRRVLRNLLREIRLNQNFDFSCLRGKQDEIINS